MKGVTQTQTLSAVSRARIARRKAERLGLRLCQRGAVFTLRDADGATVEVGPLAAVEAYLGRRYTARRPGPPRTTSAPAAWAPLIDDYLVTLAAVGQRPATIALRRALLCRMTRGLDGVGPIDLTGERLVAWFGRQTHWSIETRRSYRATARGFFAWAYKAGRVPAYLGDELPPVRQRKAPPRPAPDHAWRAALEAADARVTLMLRLAGEAGLRRAEVSRVHHRDLVEGDGGWSLLVHGKGDKKRLVPISDSLAEAMRACLFRGNPKKGVDQIDSPGGWLFPTGLGGHLTAGQVGKLVAQALPDGWTMHTLRHRFATRAYRGTHNLRAVQVLLGHESVATTERYVGLDDSEIRAAMEAASATN